MQELTRGAKVASEDITPPRTTPRRKDPSISPPHSLPQYEEDGKDNDNIKDDDEDEDEGESSFEEENEEENTNKNDVSKSKNEGESKKSDNPVEIPSSQPSFILLSIQPALVPIIEW